MAVNRSKKDGNFTIISNKVIRNKNLSLKAKGLMAFMLSLPDDWNYSLEGLAHENKEGIHSIRQAVKELEEHGYLVRERTRRKGKLGGTEYTINEIPCSKKPYAENPNTDNPVLDNPALGNHTQEKHIYENHRQLNKDIQSKDIPSKDIPSTDELNTDCIKYGFNQR